MRLFSICLVLSLVLGGIIAWQSPVRSLDQQLLQLQLEQVDPTLARQLGGEPEALQALLLAYANDPILLAKARLAVMRHERLAVPVLLAYGEQPPFQDVLRRYGEDVVLPIQYFRENDLQSVALRHAIGVQAQALMGTLRRWWGEDGEPQSVVQADREAAAGRAPEVVPDGSPSAAAGVPLSPDERGRYAIAFLAADGYGFLGQFVLDGAGQVQWVQTERLLEGLNAFFAGGVRQLETRWRQDDPIRASDLGWAALDVAVVVSAFKLLRAGRMAAVPGRAAVAPAQRSAVLAAPLWRTSAIGVRLASYGAPAVLAYVALRHPSVLNAMFGQAAQALGLPPALGQWVGWTLVGLPVLWLLSLLLRPLAMALRAGAVVCTWASRGLRPKRVRVEPRLDH